MLLCEVLCFLFRGNSSQLLLSSPPGSGSVCRQFWSSHIRERGCYWHIEWVEAIAAANKCTLVHRQQLLPKKNYVSQSCTHADVESSPVGEKEAEMAGDTSSTAGVCAVVVLPQSLLYTANRRCSVQRSQTAALSVREKTPLFFRIQGHCWVSSGLWLQSRPHTKLRWLNLEVMRELESCCCALWPSWGFMPELRFLFHENLTEQ